MSRYILLVLFVLCVTASAHAQETLIPLDSAGKLDRITLEDEQRLGLFHEYSNFREARLYQVSDSMYALEIEYQPQSRFVKERKLLTADEVQAFRSRVTAQLQVFAPGLGLRQEGRAKFIRGTTELSLLYYGWAIPGAMNVFSGNSIVSLYFVISSSGFLIPYLATKNASVTEGMADFSWYGGTRGIVHGVLLDLLVSGDKADSRELLTSSVIVSLGEMIALLKIAEKADLDRGTVAVMGTGGDYGLAMGCGAAQLCRFFDAHRERAAAAMILAVHGAGLLTGRLMANDHPYSKGDARVLETATILGGGVFTAAADVFGIKDGDAFVVAAMTGSATGFALGHVLTRDTRFSDGQGSLISLGVVGGALMGTGIAYMVTRGRGNERPYTGLAALGGMTGFWLGYKAFAPHAQHKTSFWDMRVSPQPMVSSISTGAPRLIPGITARLSF